MRGEERFWLRGEGRFEVCGESRFWLPGEEGFLVRGEERFCWFWLRGVKKDLDVEDRAYGI
jgi:hypothetical protein